MIASVERRFTARRVAFGVALLAAALGTAAVADAQTPDQQPGAVRVVHGLRGLVADIYLDGTLVLPTFQPERSTDPLAIPAGDHLIEIRAAGAAATETPLLTQTVTVPAGFQGSLVAHLDADRQPDADRVRRRPHGRAGRRVARRRAPRRGGRRRRRPPQRAAGVRRMSRRRPRPATSSGPAPTRSRSPRSAGGTPLAPPQSRAVRRRHGQLHVPHRLPGRRHAGLGGRPDRQPADGAGDDPDRRRQHRVRPAAAASPWRSSPRPASLATGGVADRGAAGAWRPRADDAAPPAVAIGLGVVALAATGVGALACGRRRAPPRRRAGDDDGGDDAAPPRTTTDHDRPAPSTTTTDVTSTTAAATATTTTTTIVPIVTHAADIGILGPGRRRRAGARGDPGARGRRSGAGDRRQPGRRARRAAGRPHARVVPPSARRPARPARR